MVSSENIIYIFEYICVPLYGLSLLFAYIIHAYMYTYTHIYVHINVHVAINEKVYKFKGNGEAYMGEFRRGKKRQNVIIKIKFQ